MLQFVNMAFILESTIPLLFAGGLLLSLVIQLCHHNFNARVGESEVAFQGTWKSNNGTDFSMLLASPASRKIRAEYLCSAVSFCWRADNRKGLQAGEQP